ncbi:hypothetical protein E2C01_082423 [Portunus trituberculatus]|uniref:Ig-like domain-containing protein n=1 Tax=Portunus trituberculatus TaxID=210409 RepID=A0A5B7J1M0_PORTR|nr:hypothetical protein [Portunus trituberculatus]
MLIIFHVLHFLHRYTTSGLTSVLQYRPSTVRDYGTLSCYANNSVGTQKEPCTFTLVTAELSFALSPKTRTSLHSLLLHYTSYFVFSTPLIPFPTSRSSSTSQKPACYYVFTLSCSSSNTPALVPSPSSSLLFRLAIPSLLLCISRPILTLLCIPYPRRTTSSSSSSSSFSSSSSPRYIIHMEVEFSSASCGVCARVCVCY